MKFKFSRLFVILLSFLTVISSFFLFLYLSFIIQSVSSGVSLVDSLISQPFQKMSTVMSSFEQLSRDHDENKILKERLYESDVDQAELNSLKSENEELRNLLNLDNKLTSSDKVVSEVINRNTVSWSDSLLVNAGKDKGVGEQFVAVANGGLVGLVTDVNSASSKVTLLTNSSFSGGITVKIEGQSGAVYGVLRGFDIGKSAFIVDQLNSDGKIENGDQVSTSGLGDYPVANIPVGTVLSVSEGRNGELDKQIMLKPAADFKDIRFVMLVGE